MGTFSYVRRVVWEVKLIADCSVRFSDQHATDKLVGVRVTDAREREVGKTRQRFLGIAGVPGNVFLSVYAFSVLIVLCCCAGARTQHRGQSTTRKSLPVRLHMQAKS